MDEMAWLACTDPQPMLLYLGDHASDRKRRLFAVACCRRVWTLLTEQRSRRAVEVMERFADGQATPEVVRLAAIGAESVAEDAATASDTADRQAHASAAFAALSATLAAVEQAADYAAANAASTAYHAATAENAGSAAGARTAERLAQARLVAELFGNPFRPVVIEAGWLAWEDHTIRRLAQSTYDERAFDRLPILADALEDAGCAERSILDHLRGPGPHVRGCWPLDLLLG